MLVPMNFGVFTRSGPFPVRLWISVRQLPRLFLLSLIRVVVFAEAPARIDSIRHCFAFFLDLGFLTLVGFARLDV